MKYVLVLAGLFAGAIGSRAEAIPENKIEIPRAAQSCVTKFSNASDAYYDLSISCDGATVSNGGYNFSKRDVSDLQVRSALSLAMKKAKKKLTACPTAFNPNSGNRYFSFEPVEICFYESID